MTSITIGIPFVRNRDTIADAIRSVFAQTWQDWQLLLVDDGSCDGSLEVARAVSDPRVRVLTDTTNRGLPARLNQIVANAKTDLVARLDADDMMHPERLARQVAALTADPTIDVVGTGMYAVDAAGELVGVMESRSAVTAPIDVLAKGILAHGTIVAKRTWFERHPYDARYPRAEDRELWCRTYRTSRFHGLAEPLYFVRLGPGPETLRKYRASCRDNRALYRAYGPQMGGWLATGRLLLEAHLKEQVFTAMTLAGQQGALLRRRSAPASPRDRADAERALRVIRGTKVPGLEVRLPSS